MDGGGVDQKFTSSRNDNSRIAKADTRRQVRIGVVRIDRHGINLGGVI